MSTILKLHQRCKWTPVSLNVINQRNQHTRTQTKRLPKYEPIDIVPVFRRASNFTDKVALRDSFGYYTYGNLFMGAKELSEELKKLSSNSYNQKILYLTGNDANYILTQWAIWMSGNIAVPLSPKHPQNLIEYYATDSNAKLIVTTSQYAELVHRVCKNVKTKLFVLDEKLVHNTIQKSPKRKADMEAGLPADFYNKSNAMILYTSGTTGKPKGVLLSHKNIVSQITCLIDAWKWTEKDTLLHTLPLHHVHGIVNALLCPHYIGAKCIMLPKFDSNTVWAYLLGVNTNPDDRRISVFMAVPTAYQKLINEYQKVFSADNKMVEYIKLSLKNKIRLMVSGSAPLPQSIFNKWFEISGHKLLERYGMTEIGMCLSNLYEDTNREPGYVGVPLPGVSIRLAEKLDDGEENYVSLLESTNVKGEVNTKITGWDKSGDPLGELQVKGDNVFKEYYNRPNATQQEFTIDGWFKTGDISQYSLKDKKFKLLGRKSVDIIKSGGYKISALSIETHLLEHPSIVDCAVVGVQDDEWGEKIVAIIVLKKGVEELNVDEFNTWAKTLMPAYCVPKDVKIVNDIPKNAMGKVNKKELVHSICA